MKRAADRFALIGAAGELATEWNLTGWTEGEAMAAAERCFKEWIEQRGTAGASDSEQAVRQVRAFLEAHGASRFQMLKPLADDTNTDADTIRDRAGFRRRDADGEIEYLILPETFRTEVCSGYSAGEVLKELDRRGLLVRTQPAMTIKPRLPEMGIARVYCVRGAILGGDEWS